MKKLVGYLLFFIVLVIGFWYFLFKDNDMWQVKLPVLSYVKPFSFVNQDGNLVTETALQNKVTVVEYFFTTCRGICPKMNRNMQLIYQDFAKESAFQILSHTCNPETDSAAILKKYADSLKVDTKKWIFVTGRKDSLYNQARNSYLLDDPKNNLKSMDEQFLHTQFFALVDKNGVVRGQIYDGLKQNELEQLRKDIQKLLKEKAGKSGFANSIFNNNPQ